LLKRILKNVNWDFKQEKKTHEQTRKKLRKGTKVDIEDIIIKCKLPQDDFKYA